MAASAREFFQRTVPEQLTTGPQRFKLGVTFSVNVAGAGEWTVNLRSFPPSIEAGIGPRADLAIRLPEPTFSELLASPEKGMDLYYRGALKVDGDLNLAPQVMAFFRLLGEKGSAALTGLDLLVNPVGADRFLAEHWPHRHLFIDGPVERLGGLHDIPELYDVDSLLRAWRGLVAVFPAKSGDEQDAPMVSTDQAKELWRRGFALVFNGVHIGVPRLIPILRRLQADLGLPSLTQARCIIYATPKGAGAKPHFDQNANFVVQLRGEKVWRLAPNPAITNPTTRSVMGAEIPAELQLQARGEFAREMPADAETLHLRRGSVLFLPNAYWHSTQAGESGLALNFTFSQPSWADLMSEVVRRRLSLHPKWRELAQGAGSSDVALARQANDRLATLLERFEADLGKLSAPSITAGFGGPSRESTVALDLKRDWVATLSPDEEA